MAKYDVKESLALLTASNYKAKKLLSKRQYNMQKSPDSPEASYYIDKFGGWKNALEKALKGGIEGFLKDHPNRSSLDIYKNDSRKNNKRSYFVTSAIAGAPADPKFLKAVLSFCKSKKANLVVLPMRGVYQSDEGYDDSIVALADHFATEYIFNNNLVAADLNLHPQQMNPLNGLQRLGQKDKSVIVASPKQQMKSVPVSNTKLPHILYSTGSITAPNYAKTRSGTLSDQDHVVGGLIVEIENNEIFFIRNVSSNSDGSFYDLGIQYNANGTTQAHSPEGFVMGDYHNGSEDPTAVKAWKEVIKQVKPNKLFWHDILDGLSVNPHAEDDMEAQHNIPDKLKNIESEIDMVAQTLKDWRKEFPNIEFIIVASNHDDFLNRYLKKAKYAKDRNNHRISLDLAGALLDGKNPIEFQIDRKHGKIKNVKWLTIDEDFKIGVTQLGAHGHFGPNGSRGAIMNIELAYGDSITGHSHSPGILRNAMVVGTTTKFKLGYNKGASSWMHASALVYKNSKKQLIFSINGKWKA